MECFKCGVDVQKSLLFGMNVGFCPKCRLVFTDHQQFEIESIRAELSTLKAENQRLRSGLEKEEAVEPLNCDECKMQARCTCVSADCKYPEGRQYGVTTYDKMRADNKSALEKRLEEAERVIDESCRTFEQDPPGYLWYPPSSDGGAGWECGECGAMDGSGRRSETKDCPHEEDCMQGAIEKLKSYRAKYPKGGE